MTRALDTRLNPMQAARSSRGSRRLAIALLAAAVVAGAQQARLAPADYEFIGAHFRAAKNLEQKGELAGAASEYRTILQQYPTAVPRVYHNLGLVHYYQRDYPNAIEAFESGIELDRAMIGSRLFLGVSYLNVERPERALPHLETAHGMQQTFETALHLGQAYAANLRYGEAIHLYRQALPMAGGEVPNVLYSIGQAYLDLAERIANEQAVSHPESKETHLAAARVFESQQVYQVAAIKYLEAAELDPFNASIFFPLARMLAILGLEVPSSLALKRYWSLLPAVPKMPIDKSMLPKEQVAEIGTKVEFEGILRSLPAVDPERLPPMPMVGLEINQTLLGRLAGSASADWEQATQAVIEGRFEDALAVLERIRDTGDEWLREYLKMTVHVWLDDYKSAALVADDPSLSASSLQAVQTFRAEVFRQISLEYFDSLVREHPSSCRARLVRAMNFAAQEKAEAEGEFLAAIEACPLDTQIRIELADYYLWNSQYDEARQACLDELQIHPHSGAAKKRLGRIHVQLREGERALPYLIAAAEADPEDADVRTDLGRAYELLQQWDDAVKTYLLALDLDPTLNRVHYVLARLYRQLGQNDLAQQQFQLFKRNEDEARQTRTARIQRLRKKEAPGPAPSDR